MVAHSKTNKKDTKIIAYDKSQRVWIYEGVDPETGTAFYVGRTNDLLRRGAEHDRQSSACKLLRERLKIANFKFKDVVRVVPELPNGVPASRASEFEAFFICERGTLFDANPANKRLHVCNQNNGANVASLDYERIKAEVEAGFEWPEVPCNVIKARAEEAVLEELVVEFGKEDKELFTALAEATMARKQVERTYMSPVAIAESLADEYEAKPKYETIDRKVFEADVNSLRDKLNDEDTVDDKMLSLVRAIALFGKSEGAEWEMRAHVGGNAFRMLAGALETREEARLPNTTVVKSMKLVRDWSVANDRKKPAPSALMRKDGTGTAEEKSLGRFLVHWKNRQRVHKKPNKSACDFIMRNLPWWTEFADSWLNEKSVELATKVCAMLRDGYGHRDEPEFEGKKKWPSGGKGTETKSLYDGMKTNLVGGFARLKWVEAVLQDVDPARADWYLAQWRAKRPTALVNMTASGKRRLARGHANGAPQKRCKTEYLSRVQIADW